MTFNTYRYENEYGKPRGFGAWAFKVMGEKDPVFVYSSMYSEAKKVIRKRFPDVPYVELLT